MGQFAHLYVHFVSMKRMYIIVEAQGDWHSLSVSVLNRYSTNRVSTMYIQMISYLYCNLIELYSKCIALILNMWYIGGSFGTRPCLVAYPTARAWAVKNEARRGIGRRGVSTKAPRGRGQTPFPQAPHRREQRRHRAAPDVELRFGGCYRPTTLTTEIPLCSAAVSQ